MFTLPDVLPIRKQVEITTEILRTRLDQILPRAMREAEMDMWLIICQEDALDPIYKTMIPMDTWPKVLQILIFFDQGKECGIEKINLSMTDTHDLYQKPWRGGNPPDQWRLLSHIIEERDPKRIGINIGDVNWAAGGLTHTLYHQLVRNMPEIYISRLVSAETACTLWGMTLTGEELDLYPSIVSLARRIITQVYAAAIPDQTTLDDLEWAFWQICAQNHLEQSFKPYYSLQRSDLEAKKYPAADRILRRGDLLVCDVGIRYLGLFTDHQELAYVRHTGESDAPDGLKRLLATSNRLQDIFMREFQHGLSGNQLLENIQSAAKEANISSPYIFSHSLGLFVHEPGPVIGLPWDQSPIAGRGDVKLEYNTCFAMELAHLGTVPEWNNQRVGCQTEQMVQFTKDGCALINGRQTEFHLI